MASTTIRSLQWSTRGLLAHSTAAFFCIGKSKPNRCLAETKSKGRNHETLSGALMGYLQLLRPVTTSVAQLVRSEHLELAAPVESPRPWHTVLLTESYYGELVD